MFLPSALPEMLCVLQLRPHLSCGLAPVEMLCVLQLRLPPAGWRWPCTGMVWNRLAPHRNAPPLGTPPFRLGALPPPVPPIPPAQTRTGTHLLTLTFVLPSPSPSSDTHERLAALCPTPDGRLLLAAGTSGLVTLRWLHSLQVG